MSCVLRIDGEDLDADALVRVTSLSIYRVDRKGETGLLRSRGPHKRSAVHIDVSDAPFSDLSQQIADAVAFLDRNADAIAAAARFPGVQDARLDFGVEAKDVAIDSNYLPPDLLRRAGELGVGIELSMYPPAGPDAPS